MLRFALAAVGFGLVSPACYDADEPPSDAELARRASALRKRFMRLKDQLREQIRARDAGG